MTPVTLGIVAYNTPIPTLKATIASALGQVESLVVLCNASDPEYQKIVSTMGTEMGFEVLSDRANAGFGAGHNAIFREATTSKWYVCCNPDVVVAEGTISALTEFAERNSDAVLVAPQVLNVDGTPQKVVRPHLTVASWTLRQLWRLMPKLVKPYEETFDYSVTQTIEFVSGAFFLVSSENFRKLGGFSEDFFLYCEDADLSRRASGLGRNYYVAEAAIIHAWQKQWTKSYRHIKLQIQALAKYFWRHPALF